MYTPYLDRVERPVFEFLFGFGDDGAGCKPPGFIKSVEPIQLFGAFYCASRETEAESEIAGNNFTAAYSYPDSYLFDAKLMPPCLSMRLGSLLDLTADSAARSASFLKRHRSAEDGGTFVSAPAFDESSAPRYDAGCDCPVIYQKISEVIFGAKLRYFSECLDIKH